MLQTPVKSLAYSPPGGGASTTLDVWLDYQITDPNPYEVVDISWVLRGRNNATSAEPNGTPASVSGSVDSADVFHCDNDTATGYVDGVQIATPTIGYGISIVFYVKSKITATVITSTEIYQTVEYWVESQFSTSTSTTVTKSAVGTFKADVRQNS
jgi:hypothetical protein